MATYSDVHAGTVIISHDGALWGVLACGPGWVTLTRHGVTVTGQVTPDTEVIVHSPADVTELARAAQCLIDGGLAIEIMEERLAI